MLLASTRTKDGKFRLVIGLQEENIERLKNDQPIMKDLGEEGIEELENWELAILGPEDTVRFIAHFGIQFPDG